MSNIFRRTHMCGELRISDVDREVVLNGWVAKRRNLGGLIFVDLRDKTGIVQVTFDDTVPEELFKKADSLRSEYTIGIKGVVKERAAKNDQIPTGDVEVFATDMVIYSESDTPPIYVKDNDNVDDNLRLKYRYLDLRKQQMQ
ncbi:MAG: Asp-tRNA(Asn)/Glu-tRNA(Gln) amidotransferase GatCAB subunit C, partial [Firmicutes bacterium]|nr:Asp-tRNA(Asn)/Glu-tRNA(Gln) amidotransferase GatCAB subunit C [Bacillota bacterium]